MAPTVLVVFGVPGVGTQGGHEVAWLLDASTGSAGVLDGAVATGGESVADIVVTDRVRYRQRAGGRNVEVLTLRSASASG